MHSITAVVLGPTTVNVVAEAVGSVTGGSVTTGVVTGTSVVVGATDPLVVAAAARTLSVKDADVVERTSVADTLTVGSRVSVLRGNDEVVALSDDGKEQM